MSRHSLREFRLRAERRYVRMLLRKNDNNVRRVAQILGLDRTYTYKLFERLDIQHESTRQRHTEDWDREIDPALPAKRGNCTRYTAPNVSTNEQS